MSMKNVLPFSKQKTVMRQGTKGNLMVRQGTNKKLSLNKLPEMAQFNMIQNTEAVLTPISNSD